MDYLLQLQKLLDKTRTIDFLGPLALRLYLAPIFWLAGTGKFSAFEDTAAWFGNPDWGLGLPFPTLLAFLAIPLMFTMLVAAFSVHWQHGWQAIADAKFCLFNCADAQDAAVRLDQAKEILQQSGNYDWLTEQGSFVVLNNGIEFAATYFIMLLVLFFIGAGRFVSVDDWLARKFKAI
jgi:putative oxidoreductase